MIRVSELINELWRAEIRAHWPRRCIQWRRSLIRQYVLLLRLREDRRPERIMKTYKAYRDSDDASFT